MTTQFGLTKTELSKIINVLKQYVKEIETAIIFGSRARGDFKKVSDIDIAIAFRNDGKQLNRIRRALQLENIIYTIDIIDYNKINNMALKNTIDHEGILLFSSNDRGDILMTKEKINQKLTDLERAFDKLKQSLLRDAEADDLVVDASIKRFEFTYELSWKLMKAYLEYNGNLNGSSPRRAIQEAFKISIVKNGDGWLDMLEDRNRSSHTYDELTAKEIYQNIKLNYSELFEAFINQMKIELAKE